MMDRGNSDNGNRISCDQIQEQLHIRNPDRFDITSMHSIDYYVQSCLRAYQREKRRGQEGLHPATGPYKMPEQYSKCTNDIIREDYNIMPHLVEAKVIEALNIQADSKSVEFWTKEQISTKASYLKRKIRKERDQSTATRVNRFVVKLLFLLSLRPGKITKCAAG